MKVARCPYFTLSRCSSSNSCNWTSNYVLLDYNYSRRISSIPFGASRRAGGRLFFFPFTSRMGYIDTTTSYITSSSTDSESESSSSPFFFFFFFLFFYISIFTSSYPSSFFVLCQFLTLSLSITLCIAYLELNFQLVK